MEAPSTLHLLCGKAAAGKSTLAARLARAPATVLIAQDRWMARLYPDLKTVDDHLRTVPRLRDAMDGHIADLLRAGVSVVLDWPANTKATRRWMRGIFESAGAEHRLHYLEAPNEVCLQRLHTRNAAGGHEYTLNPEEFEALTRVFEPPTAEEGFVLTVYPAHGAHCEPPRE